MSAVSSTFRAHCSEHSEKSAISLSWLGRTEFLTLEITREPGLGGGGSIHALGQRRTSGYPSIYPKFKSTIL